MVDDVLEGTDFEQILKVDGSMSRSDVEKPRDPMSHERITAKFEVKFNVRVKSPQCETSELLRVRRHQHRHCSYTLSVKNVDVYLAARRR